MEKVSTKTDEQRRKDTKDYTRLKMKDTFNIMKALEDGDEVKANHLISESGIDISKISELAANHASNKANDTLVDLKDNRLNVGHHRVQANLFSQEDTESQEAFMQMYSDMSSLSQGDKDTADALKKISTKVMKGDMTDKYDIATAISEIEGIDISMDKALESAGKMMVAKDKSSDSFLGFGASTEEVSNSAQFHYNEKVKNGMLYNRNRRKEMLSAQIGAEAAELFVSGEESGAFSTAEGKQEIMDRIRKMEGNSGVTYSALEELSRTGIKTEEMKEKEKDKQAEDRMNAIESDKANIKSEEHLREMLRLAQEG
ncbi:MAG TPA: hypothetical protein EYP82_00665 [Hydrogenothermaceae bacterium]|nr:hypothetical protein [Hydrogenothermaceae bacterium]